MGEGHQEHHRGPGPWVLEPDSLGPVSDELERNTSWLSAELQMLNNHNKNSQPPQHTGGDMQCNVTVEDHFMLALVDGGWLHHHRLNKRPLNVGVKPGIGAVRTYRNAQGC